MIGSALEEASPDRERWLLSYADLLTLLLAFFIVMYSMSVVDKDKLEKLSNSMTEALDKPGGDVVEDDLDLIVPYQIPDLIDEPIEALEPNLISTVEDARRAGRVAQQITQLGFEDIDVTNAEGGWLEVVLDSEVMFDSGSATLRLDRTEALSELLSFIDIVTGQIQIVGHTDDIPISTAFFPSNWELSAARAAAVVRYLERMGIAGERLAAKGHGATKPIAGNFTREGRRQNRRVVFKIKHTQVDLEALRDFMSKPDGDIAAAASQKQATDAEYPMNLNNFEFDDIDPELLQQVLRELEDKR